MRRLGHHSRGNSARAGSGGLRSVCLTVEYRARIGELQSDPGNLTASLARVIGSRSRSGRPALIILRHWTPGCVSPWPTAVRPELALSCFHQSVGSYNPARLQVAVTTLELAADGRLSTLGPAHPDTLATWDELRAVGATAEGRPPEDVGAGCLPLGGVTGRGGRRPSRRR
jgi:hypothetical protein